MRVSKGKRRWVKVGEDVRAVGGWVWEVGKSKPRLVRVGKTG